MTEPIDPEQEAAIKATEPAIGVLAGPGSGKTRTLSRRTRHLLEQDPKSRALLLTFTNKAAAEMKARAVRVSKLAPDRIHASTFHTFCAEVLRSHGVLLGYQSEFDILDSDEAEEIAESLVPDDGARAWLFRLSAARLRRAALSAPLKAFNDRYAKAKLAENALDFDDLVTGVADLFEKKPELARAYATRYQHVLVDEFQDTNAVQAAIVDALAAHAQTVSIFADDDQAIFGFAGAEAANIKRFMKKVGAKKYPLTTNYRSGAKIVALANKLLESDPTTSSRRMKPFRDGGAVYYRAHSDQHAEAQEITKAVATAIAAGHKPSEFAVLVRNGYRADVVKEALEAQQIPVSDWRGDTHAPPERRAFAACLACIRGVLRGRQVRRICELMKVPTAADGPIEAFLSAHAAHPIVKEIRTMRQLAFKGPNPSVVAAAVQRAVAAADATLGKRVKSIVDAVEQFEKHDPDFTLEHLFSELALGSVGRAPTQGGGVKIASLHRTKGLQWPTVFLVGLEQGQLPDRRAASAPAVSEERRLCFVGVSRAEDRLVVMYSRKVGRFAAAQSPFLAEMGLV